MKATGIVRRIDDLGRIVIPKEIRRTMRITEGTPLEIFTDIDNTITLKKYSPVMELRSIASDYAEGLAQTFNCAVCICDSDTIVAAHRTQRKDYIDRGITTAVAKIIWDKKPVLFNTPATRTSLVPIVETESDATGYGAQCFAPIITDGDPVGCIIAFARDDGRLDESVISGARVTAALLARQMSM